MQTFSSMQRSIAYKNPLTPFLYVVAFFIYTALSGMYIFLPPFFAVLYIFFSRALSQQNTLYFLLTIFCLILFEAQNGYVLFATLIYFSIMYKFIMPKISKNFNCTSCIKIAIVLLVYIGFFLFHSLISNIFLFPEPNLSYHVIYYILIEFFIVSLL
ncbi:MAG: hypothetical protein QG559_1372 [Campylobacterota bacterium]|nr:hypothetical protein [Campylobacterota bacterium]